MRDFVVGHQRTIERLRRLLAGERVPHALLFVGREGIGKRRVALLSACIYLCSSGGCLECRTCKRVLSLAHPDVRMEGPEGKRGILIRQIRELREWAHMAPMEGSRKVAIIDDAHLMGSEAANAFLKTLEEPPEGTLFILVTSEQSKLLPTIVSRCQIVRFSPLKKEEVEEICQRERVEEEVKRLCIETGSMMFLSASPEVVRAAREVAEEMLNSPSLRLMAREEVWKNPEGFRLFLLILRRELNRRLMKSPWDTRIQRLSQRLLEVERLAYTSNVSPRSLYEHLVLEVA